ncbi:MAG TPA: cation:proton antiporter [Kofleriaceae bacterium]|jgi:Kef-type K+ transport system membrane component KefB
MIELLLLFALAGLMQAARSFTVGVIGGTELAFGFLLLTAFFAGRVVSRFGLPRLTGYLIAGVVAGSGLLDLVTTDMTKSLSVVNSVASCILGLTAGAELNLKKVKPLARTLRGLISFGVLGGIAILTGVLYLIRPMIPLFAPMDGVQSIAVCALLAVALIPQSPAVVMAILSETKADGPLSQTMLATVVVADLVVIVCYAIASAVAGLFVGGGVDLMVTMRDVAWELFGSIGFGIVIGLVIGSYLRTVKEGAALFSLMICVVVAQVGSRVHLDPLVVMLAAGIWLENFSRAGSHDLLSGFESAQLPVFLVWFALAGLRLDLLTLVALIVPVVIIAATRGLTFYVGSKMAMTGADPPPAVKKSGWVGLVPQAGLSLAFATLMANTKAFSFGAEASTIILSVLAVNQLIAPVLVRRAVISAGEAGAKDQPDFAANAQRNTPLPFEAVKPPP